MALLTVAAGVRPRYQGPLQGADDKVPPGSPLPPAAAARASHAARCQVVEAFLNLRKPYQDAIAEVTMKMGAGMAEFIAKDVRRSHALSQQTRPAWLIRVSRW